MAYRTLPVITFNGPWDLILFGSHEFKIAITTVDADQRVLLRRSSPIVGPRDLLARVRAGDIPEGPIEFEVESGKIYRLMGRIERSSHSAIARPAPAPRSRLQQLLDRIAP